MINVKDLILKKIDSKLANDFIRKYHYSGKVVPNSCIHFGVFHNNIISGVLSYGPSINKKGTINLVNGTKWNEFIELNRMAFIDKLPKNSESRCISVSMRLLKKYNPNIKWIISFADACQCGDGAIYRASGFMLVGINKNTSIKHNINTGEKMHVIQAHHKRITKDFKDSAIWKPIVGYQLKYIYFFYKEDINKLSVPVISFSKIKELGASMYKGQKCVGYVNNSISSLQDESGGVSPTPTLQKNKQY